MTSNDRERGNPGAPRPNPGLLGLCPGCRHLRRITSERGAEFYLCGRSRQDARFPKYPPQPVIACAGFEAPPPPAP